METLQNALNEKENESHEWELKLDQERELQRSLYIQIAEQKEVIDKLQQKVQDFRKRMDEKAEIYRVQREKGNQCLEDLSLKQQQLEKLKNRMAKQRDQVELLQSQLNQQK